MIKNPEIVKIYRFVWFDNGVLEDVKIETDNIHTALYYFYTKYYKFEHNINIINVFVAYDCREEYKRICIIKE